MSTLNEPHAIHRQRHGDLSIAQRRAIIDLTEANDEEVEDMTCDDLYPPPIDEAQQVDRVERIQGYARLPDGSAMYRVKCFGYPESEGTWEPECNLSGCKEAVDAYNAMFKMFKR